MSLPDRVVTAALLALVAAADIPAQSFTQGDLYLYSPTVTAGGAFNGAVVHIDLATGNASIPVGLLQSLQRGGAIAYDPYRDGLLFCGVLNSAQSSLLLWCADALGNTRSLGLSGEQLSCLAPTGDGRVYLRRQGPPIGQVYYLDAANQIHVLQDPAGVQPFSFGTGSWSYHAMIYHAPTRSLFAAGPSNRVGCSGVGTTTAVTVRRATLSADGTHVVGPQRCAEFEVSTSSERPVGLSQLADGTLLLVVDTNSNAAESRMLRIDPWSMAITSYAVNGSYSGAAATNAGTYSSTLGKAVILDTLGDKLRAFAMGESGSGTTVPTSMPLSGGGSNETATLIEIRDAPCAGGFAGYGDGLVGAGGYEPTIAGTGCPTPGQPLAIHLGSVVGAAPGALLAGSVPAAQPLFGGTVLVLPAVAPPILVGGTAGAPGDGALSIPLLVPAAPGVSGVSVYFQGVFIDAAAAQGLSFTSGVRVTIG